MMKRSDLDVNLALRLARYHLSTPSSRLCLADAVELNNKGDLGAAVHRAADSLKYSVGVLHPDYARVAAMDVARRVVAEPLPDGSSREQRWILKRATGGATVGFLTKFKNTRTDRHPYKIWSAYHTATEGFVFGRLLDVVYGSQAQALRRAAELL